MRKILQKVFWPLLRIFETGEDAVGYQKSHRIILIILGVLFLGLSFGSAWMGNVTGEMGALIPMVVFFAVGFVALVLGIFGSDSAVCKIWRSRS
ncbi:hypothetical protein [Nitrincola schmidtii]|uniref:hypothetical protein n=1 Tax=Nitrincola schmidtii TaxID=1730894 RepID=UPI00124DB4E8|nr:hypothetical protein [Nitrincola schmidtii]